MEHAAFFNGFLSHLLEMDDVEKKSISHPSAVVVPAALAAGEWAGKTGKELIEAIVAGYEIMIRIGAAMTPNHFTIWHTTATAGTFGAAIAASKMFDLSRPQMDWALGNAGTMANGLWQFLRDGADTKCLHVGKAAANGLSSAYLARLGLSGATRILEGIQGFYAGFALQKIDPIFFSDFGVKYYTNEIAIKIYPCCGQAHSAIDAAVELASRIDGRNISGMRIEVTTVAKRLAGRAEYPTTSLEKKFSISYCVAHTILHGPVTEKSFSSDSLVDGDIRDLMLRTEIEACQTMDTASAGLWPCRIVAVLKDGSEEVVSVPNARGGVDNPLDWSEITNKFSVMTNGIIARHRMEDVCSACQCLESITSVGEILALVNDAINLSQRDPTSTTG
jgi:2-methylcitrate dehydratase PrpD